MSSGLSQCVHSVTSMVTDLCLQCIINPSLGTNAISLNYLEFVGAKGN